MPRYQITAPNGQVFQINAPDGATEQDALAYAQSQFGGNKSLPVATAAPAAGAPQPQAAQPTAPQQESGGMFENLGRGAWQGVTDMVAGPAQLVGNAYVSAVNSIPGLKNTQYAKDIKRNADQTNGLIRQNEADYQAATPGSVAAGVGRVGANVAGALVGGGGKAVQTLGQVGELLPFVAGAGPRAVAAGKLVGTAAGGAGLGAATSALAPVTEEGDYWRNKAGQVGTGAAIGAALPFATQGALSAGRYVGNAARSLVDPFTEAGQTRIAGDIVRRFAQGGPMNGAAGEIVPGSVPTLSQVTGNAGIAALERGFQSSIPKAANDFERRLVQNAAARTDALAGTTGTAADLAAAKATRAANAADDYLATHIGIPTSSTEYAALKETPAFRSAFARAQAMARNAGTSVETTVQNRANANLGGAAGKTETYVSGRGLQIIKEALDDQIDKAARAGAGKQAANIRGVKDRLVAMMDSEIPGYAEARASYAEASRPIDAMQYLQGLNITDAKGNITLAKVKNALQNLEKMRNAPGVNDAKSVTQDQIDTLRALHADLLRDANSTAGKAPGSNTFQNLATNNILQNALPGPVRALMGGTNGPVSTLAGKAGNLLYGGANEAIQNRLSNMLLNPNEGLAALRNVNNVKPPLMLRGNGLLNSIYPDLLPAATVGAGVASRNGK
ncbi:hypothetical protein CBM2599_A120489 [Cupriavidus taiwanensis]|uniref:hypothetical protein n=1 Tax=Cupriavidus taiwanensis TaxID=164546 RepID=UPI000E15EA55|nr:hypothetical protein [Cupriavidus taiwanensis]SOY79924.1 hypothetical protein CBM2599_A120489 [Cupriavidus taiwanensis]SOY81893.1 hypothetical protein CBM2600_A120511 [Cupriavidus taiwanensis]